MVSHDFYFWLGKINQLIDQNKYYTAVFNDLKYSRDKTVSCDNLTSRLTLSGGSAFTLGTGVLIGRFLFSQQGGSAGNLTVRATESV
jgi:hypothetical protein